MATFIGLKVTPKNFASRIGRLRNYYTRQDRLRINQFITVAIQKMRENTPVNTGKTKSSIRVLKKVTANNITDLRSNLVIGSDYPVFGYLDRGTKPSAGRFVSVINKRLKSTTPGAHMHPGNKPFNILSKTQRFMESWLDNNSQGLLNRWTRQWDSQFPG